MHTEDKTAKTRNWVIVGLIILLAAVAAYFFLVSDEKTVPIHTASIESAPLSATPAPPSAMSEPLPVTSEPLPTTPETPPTTSGTLLPTSGPSPLPGAVLLPPTAFEVPPILYPIEPASSDEPLPEPEYSDKPFREALGNVLGRRGLSLVLSDELIYHIVVTIDNLPRKYLPASIVPLKRAENSFMVEGKEENLVISAQNVKRYGVYIAVAKAIDSVKLVDLYRRYYPLFQNAYREIGYVNANFNDRLVVTIDDLIAAPVPQVPVRLAQPKVLYEYADPNLERRSAGQKIMMRIGPENAAILKAKLSEIRGLVTR